MHRPLSGTYTLPYLLQAVLRLLQHIRLNKQCLVKSVVYRCFSLAVTFIVAFGLTGNLSIAAYIGVFDSLLKVVTYYAFDEMWRKSTSLQVAPVVLWLTGLSGAGKTTIAHALVEKMKRKGITPVLLDGDEIRNAIKLTGFDEDSRKKHNLNVGYIASLFERQGCVVIVSLISPYDDVRQEVRKMCRRFAEIYVSTPLEVCIERDPKGLYRKAIAGEIAEFTGISSPYHAPLAAEINIDTSLVNLEQSTQTIINYIRK